MTQTGRGVPLVELRTVNGLRYVTDSNGIVAFDEPGLMGRSVFFHVNSHGYEFPKDGFGFRGKALTSDPAARRRSRSSGSTSPSGSIASPARASIATACSRAVDAPIAEPVLNGQVFGSGQRRERRLPRQDPLVLGRHEPARLSAGQLPRARRDVGAAGRRRARPRAGSRPELLRRRRRASPGRRRRCPARARPG